MQRQYDRPHVTVLLASDSTQAQPLLVARLSTVSDATFTVISLAYNRTAVNGDDHTLPRQRTRIEQRNGAGAVDRSLAFGSIMADLALLSRADAIVGTSTSCITRLSFQLIAGRVGSVPPFVFLDAPWGAAELNHRNRWGSRHERRQERAHPTQSPHAPHWPTTR